MRKSNSARPATRIACLSALMAGTFAMSAAQAIDIPLASLAGPLPAAAGNGLNGSFWDTSGFVSTNAGADAVIAGGSPTRTFVSTKVDYPNGSTADVADGTALADFLGVDAASLNASGTGLTMSGSVFQFGGYLAIKASDDKFAGNGTIDVDFQICSDDGSRVRIGGVTVTEADGAHSFSCSALVTASFASEGLYAVDIIYFEDGGVTGVAWLSSIGGDGTIVPTDRLYTTLPATGVSEPTTLALLGLGFAGLGFGRRAIRPR